MGRATLRRQADHGDLRSERAATPEPYRRQPVSSRLQAQTPRELLLELAELRAQLAARDGEDLDREQLRTFALPRMRNARPTSTRFRRPADFSITKVLSGSFGVFEGGKKHRIRLQFDAFAGRLVSERTWHESQRIKPARDGSMTMQLELGGLEEIQRWILSWGSHVRVLEPQELAERVATEAQAVAQLYGNRL